MKFSRTFLTAMILAALLLMTSCTTSTNWPQFRGPAANMVADGSKIPDTWSAEKGVKWVYEINGAGWSSPVIWGNKVFITSSFPEKVKPAPQMGPDGPRPPQGQGPQQRPGGQPGQGPGGPRPEDNDTSFKADVYRWEVTCLDLNTGKEVWKKVAFHGNPRSAKHPMNNYACETPVTDGKRVYAYFGMIGLYCYDMDGNLLWENDLGSYKTQNGWGTGSSPVIFNGNIFIQIDNEERSFIVSIDAVTGKEKWRNLREEKTNYSTPYIWKNRLRNELVAGGKTIRSYDPASGKMLWELKAGGEQSIPSATGDESFLYIGNEGSGEKKAPFFAIKAGASGDITPADSASGNQWIAWNTLEAGLGSGSPLLYEGLIYNFGGRGELSVISAADGKQAYFKKINGMGSVWASPWASHDRIYVFDEKGITHILKPGNTFSQTGEARIEDKFWASAAIAGNKLVLRGEKKVWCVGE